MAIENGDLATVVATLLDLRGNKVDATGEEGVSVRVGNGDVFPRLDQALLGKEKGADFEIELEPEESFGDFDAELIHLVPVSVLGVPRVGKGMRFSRVPGIDDASERAYIVTDIAEGMAVLDGNHPYAGWTLKLSCKVLRYEKGEGDDVEDSDILIPDFLKAASEAIAAEGEERLAVEEARRRMEEERGKAAETAPAGAMGDGLFTSLVPGGGEKGGRA